VFCGWIHGFKVLAMVDPKVMTDRFAVSPQLAAADFVALAAAGYKTIINNRPDNEEPGQLSAAEAQALAEAQGMNYVHIPVKIPELTAATVEQFGTALQSNPGPILAHCRTGTRSFILWTMVTAKSNTMTLEELMQCAADGGYDLSKMRPLIEQYMNAV
jgi:sulfide:quinone oxidoreductase